MSLSLTSTPRLSASCWYSLLWIKNWVAFAFRFASSTLPAAGNFRFVAAKFRRVCAISASHSAFEICSSPTTATESSDTDCGPPLPHATTSSAIAAQKRISGSRLMEKAPAAGVSSRCPARVEYSIDQSNRYRKFIGAQRNLAARAHVDGGPDLASQRAQLRGAEQERADRSLAAAEDQVVRSGSRELQLRLLDREQVLDGLGQRAVAVLGGRLQLAQLVFGLRQREAAVEVDLERLGLDVRRRHVRVHGRLYADRPRRRPPLARQLRAEQVARAADLEVAHRDREAGAELGVVRKRREARPRLRRQLARIGIEEVGMGEDVGAPDAPADLVELGEPQRVRPLHDQRVRLRDVEARLDDRRRDEHVRVAAQERMHLLLELALPHLAVRDLYAERRRKLLDLGGSLVDRLDAVVQVEALALARVLTIERLLHELVVVLTHVRADRPAALGRCLDHRDVAEAGERHVQRARDRGGAQREHVHLEPQRAQQLLLRDAEALLLVDHNEAELLRDHIAAEHAVGADEHVDLARGEIGDDLLLLPGAAEAGDHLDSHGKVAIALAERVPVLLGEHRRRDEHQRLLAVDGHRERRAHRHLGLAEADVAADEAIHRPRRLEILLDGFDRRALVLRLAIRELGLEPLEPLVLELVGNARGLLAARVEREQLAGQLPQARARPALQVLPRLAAELAQRGRRRVGPDVLRDLADLLVRHVEAVVTAKAEEEVVARDVGDRLRLEAEQLADAMVLVDDEVAGAEVGEAVERAPRRRRASTRALAEDLRVRQQHEPEVAPDEATPRGRNGEQQSRLLGQRVARLEDARLDTPQQSRRAQRLAAVRECDDDAVARADERRQLVLRLGETARRDRRPLRLEGERLTARERVELRRALQRQLDLELLRPDLPHLLWLPHQVGRPVERCDEVARDRLTLAVLVEHHLLQVEPSLCGRIDDRVLDRVQRALRERRERADRFELVAEELDPERLASRRREDVDQGAANGELPTLLHAVDPLVSRQRQPLGERLEPRCGADDQLDRLRPGGRWRQRLGERRSRRADEAAGGEDCQRPRALADEVRRRLETRAPADAATRQQPNALLAEEPARALGRIPRVRVLGQHAHEPAA